MDAQHASTAQECLNAAYEKRMSFSEIVGTLIESGFEGYVVDYRRNTTTYFMPDGDSVVLENRSSEGAVASNELGRRASRNRLSPPLLSWTGLTLF